MSLLQPNKYLRMHLRGQMNLSAFVRVRLLEMHPEFSVRTFDTVQFLGLGAGKNQVGFGDFRNASLPVRAAARARAPPGEGEGPPAAALRLASRSNLLCESQKLIELDSYNALFNEGTNKYSKQPFVPLSAKRPARPAREEAPGSKPRAKDLKNGRLFELRGNVLFVDLLGDTAVGNAAGGAEVFAKGGAGANARIRALLGGGLRRGGRGRRGQVRVLGPAQVPGAAGAGPEVPAANREPRAPEQLRQQVLLDQPARCGAANAEDRLGEKLHSIGRNGFTAEFAPVLERRVLAHSQARNRDSFLREVESLANLQGLAGPDAPPAQPQRAFVGEPAVVSILVTNNFKVG